MSPESLAALLRDYGAIGLSALLIIAIGWLYRELRLGAVREIESEREHATQLIQLHKEYQGTMMSGTRAIDALTLNIQNRNPLTEVLGESQKATAQAVERLRESLDRLTKTVDDDRRDADVHRSQVNSVQADIKETLRRLEARLASLK